MNRHTFPSGYSIAENKGKKLNAAITTPDILPSLLSFTGISIPENGIQDGIVQDDVCAFYCNI